MSFVRRWWWLLLVLLIGVAWMLYRNPPAVSQQASTELQIEVYGGFAFVPTPADRQLEIAYLKDTAVTDCTVKQLGTDLMVEEGTIVEPATPPPSKMFDLAGTVVKFPDLEAAKPPLNATRGNRPTSPPFGPVDPDNPAHWEPLHWVPSLSAEHTTSSLNPRWRELVNGRVVLHGGRIKGLHPSDVVVKGSLFEFRRGSTPVFRQAITDRLEYSVRVPSDRVVMLLDGPHPTKKVVITSNPGRPVRLRLLGRHAKSTGGTLPVGAGIEHYCAFYQLMQPIPAPAEWLLPYYVGSATPANAAGQPSPGLFCPGDWF